MSYFMQVQRSKIIWLADTDDLRDGERQKEWSVSQYMELARSDHARQR